MSALAEKKQRKQDVKDFNRLKSRIEVLQAKRDNVVAEIAHQQAVLKRHEAELGALLEEKRVMMQKL